jgi:four helix bundle protein
MEGDLHQVDSVIVITKTYDLILYLIPQLAKLPRDQKFLLGDRIERILLDILDLLIEAQYSKEKLNRLIQTNLTLEKLRFMIRLAKDLNYLPIKKYGYTVEQIDEIGRMIGGWIKHQKVR